MKKLLILCVLVVCGVGPAWAMDEDEGTNGEDPAGCEDNPSLCAEPDPDQEPPGGYDQECYSCDTWEATCETSVWDVCLGDDGQGLPYEDPFQVPTAIECLARCGTFNCSPSTGGGVTCPAQPSGSKCDGMREGWVHPFCKGGSSRSIDCRYDECGNLVPY